MHHRFGLFLCTLWLAACDTDESRTNPASVEKPAPNEAENLVPAAPPFDCDTRSQRFADRDCLRNGNDALCQSLTRELDEHCGGKRPSATGFPLPVEAAESLTPQRLCDLSLQLRAPVSQERCERRFEIAIEAFGAETFHQRAECWLGTGPRLQLTRPCTAPLELPAQEPPKEQIDHAVALLDPWCRSDVEQCGEHGVCSASFRRWEATKIAGTELAAGAAVGCIATDEDCAKTKDCLEHGECAAMKNGIGCYVADEEDCKESSFCAKMGMCELREGKRPGLPPEMGRYCANPKDARGKD